MREAIRDELRLRHIYDACSRLLNYFPAGIYPIMEDKSIEFFGVVKNLEIIGEAAYKLTQDFKENHPETEWKAIVRMRHIMVHGYYHISPAIVKDILESEIEKLRKQIDNYLEEFKV